MFFILFALIGGAIGYIVAPRLRTDPMVAGALGAVGGLIGGALVKVLFPILLGLIGAALGAMLLVFAYRELRRR